MQEHINIRFYAELNDFLPPGQRGQEICHELKQPRSVKDLIESIGIPHPEIDLVLVNGNPVKLDRLVQKGENISVYPLFRSLDISTIQHCQPECPRHPCFVLDVHLGRLAAYMRMLGFDTLYRNDYDDGTLADISGNSDRILLSCDRQLLMRRKVSLGYFVRAREPRQQLQEVLSRFDLTRQIKPFTRCMDCNGKTHEVSKSEIDEQLLAETKKYYNKFFQCEDCKKVYWEGSHFIKMQKMIRNLSDGPVSA